jgi:hypothetical protein
LHDSIYTGFLRLQTYTNEDQISSCQGLGIRGRKLGVFIEEQEARSLGKLDIFFFSVLGIKLRAISVPKQAL